MKRQNEIIIVLISMFIIVVVWIGVSIYHSANASTINDELIQDIVGIEPTFNTTLLEKLKNRKYIDPIYNFPSKDKNNTGVASSSASLDQITTGLNQPVIANTTQVATNSGLLGQ